MSQESKPHRVGILVVHGIGEQRQFEHLEEVVRNISFALQVDSNLDSVQVNVNVSGDAPYCSEQQTWRGERTATAIIEVIDKSQKRTNLEFREVWWSDLDEPSSFQTFLSFWSWGLSLWTKPRYDEKKVGTANKDMRLPGRNPEMPGRNPENQEQLLPGNGEPIRLWHRLYLFLVSFVILILLPFLWLLGRVLRSILGIEIRPDILVEYLGDVKLYQQDARERKGPLIDLGKKTPPRFSIRRRIIKAYVEMALENYDRWYILSHSLGTVVAFNGLMETEKALPNYLRESLWDEWYEKHRTQIKGKNSLTEEEKKRMLPQRPIWLNNDDIIDRKELFTKLRGFMTYGSPLSKFAVLWPSIVPLNKDESVFKDDFEWINVFDPTDPVSDFTRFFDSQGENSRLTPKDIPYKADQIHLLSHGQYLTFNSKRKRPLIRQVSRWLLSDEEFQPNYQDREDIDRDEFHQLGWPIPKVGKKDSPIVSIYFGLGIVIWFLLGLIISFVLSWIVPWFLNQISGLLTQLHPNFDWSRVNHFLSNPFFYVIVTVCIVLIVGVVARLTGLNRNQV